MKAKKLLLKLITRKAGKIMKRTGWKKLITAALALSMVFAMAGCGDPSDKAKEEKITSASSTAKEETVESKPSVTTATTVSEAESEITTQKVDESSEEEDTEDTDAGFQIDKIPVTISDSEYSEHNYTCNLGMVSEGGGGGKGFSYDIEAPGFRDLPLENLLSGNQFEWTDVEKMSFNDPSNGFIFNGTPYINFDYKDEKNGDLTPVPQADKDTAVYVETAVNEEGVEIVTGYAYDIEHADLKHPVRFANIRDKEGDHKIRSFILGDSKEKVEELIGKGYEYKNFAFYSTEEGKGENMMKTYTILEYGEDDTVQKVIILAKDLMDR